MHRLTLFVCFFQVYWIKDGEELDKGKLNKRNYIVSNIGNLMISQAKLVDVGNYTCGARNEVTKRTSDSANLTVYSML